MSLLLKTKISTFCHTYSILRTSSISASLIRLGGIRCSSQESSSSPPKTNVHKNSPNNDPGNSSSNKIFNILHSAQKSASRAKFSPDENESTSSSSRDSNYLLDLITQTNRRGVRTTPTNPQGGPDPRKLDLPTLLQSSMGVTATTNARGESHTLHIHATANNTLISLNSALTGGNICWSSGGTAGFKKSARSGFEAANQAAIQLLDKIEKNNVQIEGLHIVLKGFGQGRDAAVKALLEGSSWRVMRITDATPIPFNGCRPRKQRRL